MKQSPFDFSQDSVLKSVCFKPPMIRKATLDDAAAIAEIYNHYIEHTSVSFEVEPLSPMAMRERMVSLLPHFPYLLYEKDNKVLGYCYAHAWKERAAYKSTWELTIYLHHQFTGAGIGKQLMRELIAACRAQGCRVLIACITGNNVASKMFHQQFGFHQVSHFEKVGEKHGEVLDVDDFELMLA